MQTLPTYLSNNHSDLLVSLVLEPKMWWRFRWSTVSGVVDVSEFIWLNSSIRQMEVPKSPLLFARLGNNTNSYFITKI